MVKLLVTLQVLALTAGERVRGNDRERGATAVEYGLMVALIAAVIIVAVATLGDKVTGAFTSVNDGIDGAKVAP